MKRIAVIGIAAVLAICGGAFAYQSSVPSDFSYRTLTGIDTIAVRFTGFYHDFDRYGVDADRLRAEVAKRLDAAGVRVVDINEAVTQPGAALLSIDLHSNYSYYWGYAYAVSVKLHNKQPLANNPQGFVGSVVWNDGDNGIGAGGLQLRKINEQVITLVDRFINDLRAQRS
jgi:hypothetical protein